MVTLCCVMVRNMQILACKWSGNTAFDTKLPCYMKFKHWDIKYLIRGNKELPGCVTCVALAPTCLHNIHEHLHIHSNNNQDDKI